MKETCKKKKQKTNQTKLNDTSFITKILGKIQLFLQKNIIQANT